MTFYIYIYLNHYHVFSTEAFMFVLGVVPVTNGYHFSPPCLNSISGLRGTASALTFDNGLIRAVVLSQSAKVYMDSQPVEAAEVFCLEVH